MVKRSSVNWQYKVAEEIIERLTEDQRRHLCQRIAPTLSKLQLDALIARLQLLRTSAKYTTKEDK